jgi:hypothetical protein
MNIYSLSQPEADLEKLILIEFIELTWGHDGRYFPYRSHSIADDDDDDFDSGIEIAEKEPLDAPAEESERLCRAMYEQCDREPVSDDGYGLRIKRFRNIRRRMQAVDPVGWVLQSFYQERAE